MKYSLQPNQRDRKIGIIFLAVSLIWVIVILFNIHTQAPLWTTIVYIIGLIASSFEAGQRFPLKSK